MQKWWRAISGSPVMLGLMVFFAANFALLAANPLSKVDPESLPAAHTWTWWATREYLDQKTAPDVVLLGSSMMMHPVSRADADFLGADFDYVHHHQSAYLDSRLSDCLLSKSWHCFNFALPGSMASDDYMIARALLHGDKKPKVLVVGISMRDFTDSGVSCPAATPPFKYLRRFVDISNVLPLAMPEVWQRIDYCLGNLVYLWNKKLDLQVLLTQESRQFLTPALKQICTASLLDKVDPAKNMPSNMRSEIEENVFIVQAHPPASWTDNTAEYAKRYRQKHKKIFDIECQFFSKLLDFARQENIAVLAVNMPLTQKNMELMPPGSYAHYLTTVSQLARNKGAEFIDLNDGTIFNTTNFYDTAHMNASGGRKLLQEIARTIAANTKLAQAALSSPQLLATRHHKLF